MFATIEINREKIVTLQSDRISALTTRSMKREREDATVVEASTLSTASLTTPEVQAATEMFAAMTTPGFFVTQHRALLDDAVTQTGKLTTWKSGFTRSAQRAVAERFSHGSHDGSSHCGRMRGFDMVARSCRPGAPPSNYSPQPSGIPAETTPLNQLMVLHWRRCSWRFGFTPRAKRSKSPLSSLDASVNDNRPMSFCGVFRSVIGGV